MRDVTVRKLEMCVRVAGFLSKNPMVFRKGSQGPALRDQFNDVVGQVQILSAKHLSGNAVARAHSAVRGEARRDLLGAMERIRNSARGMAVTRPGVDDKFPSPGSVADSKLLACANAFVDNAEPLAKDFIEFEMPTEFLEEFRMAIAAFKQSVDVHNASRAAHVSTAGQINDAMRKAMDTLAQLDPIVTNKLSGSPELLSQWENARHIERAWSTKSKPEAKPETNAA